jgi:hypothetical protein
MSARVTKISRRLAGVVMILVLINILIIVVVGAIVFWVIDKYVRERRLANLLKLLVILVCLAAILQRLLPMLGVSF